MTGVTVRRLPQACIVCGDLSRHVRTGDKGSAYECPAGHVTIVTPLPNAVVMTVKKEETP